MLIIWTVENNQKIKVLKSKKSKKLCFEHAFSPDQKYLLGGDRAGYIYIWDATDYKFDLLYNF